MDMTADLDLFLADLSVPGVITDTGISKIIPVIFDQNSLSEMAVLTDRPQITVKSDDITGINLKTAVITINSVAWHMVKPMPNGTGFTLLNLTRT